MKLSKFILIFLLLFGAVSSADDFPPDFDDDSLPMWHEVLRSVNEDMDATESSTTTNTTNITTNTSTSSTNATNITTNTTNITNQGIKAWVRFDGTAVDGNNDLTGVDDSYNVSGVVDVSAGNYTVYWDTDFANADYVCVGSATGDNLVSFHNYTAGTVDVDIYENQVSTARDSSEVTVMAIGDQ